MPPLFGDWLEMIKEVEEKKGIIDLKITNLVTLPLYMNFKQSNTFERVRTIFDVIRSIKL